MSVAQLAVGAAALAGVTLLNIFTPNKRKIGSLKGFCTVSEHHSDTAIITDHPVEFGAPISDHMFGC